MLQETKEIVLHHIVATFCAIVVVSNVFFILAISIREAKHRQVS